MARLTHYMPKIYMTMKMVEKFLHHFLVSKNPSKMKKWHYNACIQTALVQAYFLNKFLQELDFKENDFRITVHEGFYYEESTMVNGFTRKYNHAHVFLDFSPNECYILDTTRSSNYIGFVKTTINDPIEAITRSLAFEGVRLKTVKEPITIDWQAVVTGDCPEYYTGLTYSEIIDAVKADLIELLSTPKPI